MHQLLLCLVKFLNPSRQFRVEASSRLLLHQHLVEEVVSLANLKVLDNSNLSEAAHLHLEQEAVSLANLKVVEISLLVALVVVWEVVQPVQSLYQQACSNQESEIIQINDNH